MVSGWIRPSYSPHSHGAAQHVNYGQFHRICRVLSDLITQRVEITNEIMMSQVLSGLKTAVPEPISGSG